MGIVLELDRFRTLEEAIDNTVAGVVTVNESLVASDTLDVTGAAALAGTLKIPGIAAGTTYADDTAAGTGGLVAGDVYATTTTGSLAVKL